MLILNMVYIFGIMVRKKKRLVFLSYYHFFSLTAAGDLIAREAGAYTCDPSGRMNEWIYLFIIYILILLGAPLNLVHRRILCAATKELAEQISPLLTHIDFPHD